VVNGVPIKTSSKRRSGPRIFLEELLTDSEVVDEAVADAIDGDKDGDGCSCVL